MSEDSAMTTPSSSMSWNLMSTVFRTAVVEGRTMAEARSA